MVTSLYRKPEAGNTILNAKSYDPKHTICAILYGECVRTERACSDPKTLKNKLDDLDYRLVKQGYRLLKEASNRINSRTRESLLLNKEKRIATVYSNGNIVFSTSYSTDFPAIKIIFIHIF